MFRRNTENNNPLRYTNNDAPCNLWKLKNALKKGIAP